LIKLIKPYISYNEVESEFREIFESGWFTKGKNVETFKKTLINYTGAKYAHLTTSATTALTICLKILDIKQGDEVIISDFSFPATVNVVEDLNATPVFADVDPETFNMDPVELEQKITKWTKAVIFVDALGNPGGIHVVKEICLAHDIPLIEDAACGIGSSEDGIRCGNIADFTCFSFHPRKLLSTGEGGAVLTNRDDWNTLLEIKLNHGAQVENGKFDFIDFGYNYRMSELQAVMGWVQIKKIEEIVDKRNIMRNQFIKRLEPAGYRAQSVLAGVVYNIQSLVFVVPEKISRDGLILFLKERGIESTLGTYCLSGCSYYRMKYNNVQPVAEILQNRTITLPCHDDVDPEQICKAILEYNN